MKSHNVLRSFGLVFLLAAATTNPAQLWFTQNGTGAVKRTHASKLSDTVSVMDFGAVGNGTTDDTTAFTNAAALGRVVRVPCGTYNLTSAITASATGVGFKGDGFCSVLKINHTGTGFTVTGQLFRLEDLEVQFGTGDRTGATFIDVQAAQGYVGNVRVTGNNSATSNGTAFKLITDNSDNWEFAYLRFPGGPTWERLWYLACDNVTCTGTVASTYIHDLFGGNVVTTIAGIDVDGKIDTLGIVNGGVSPASGSGPAVWFHNTNSVSGFPRWIHFSNTLWEGGSTASGVGIQDDWSVDFKMVNGYVATAATGIVIGANALETVIQSVQFVNIGQSGVTIANGAVGTVLDTNMFRDCGVTTNNTYDTIGIAANASSLKVLHNVFNDTQANKSRYHIFLAAGAGNNYEVFGNQFITAGATGNFLNTSVSGSSRLILGNWGVNNVIASSADTTTFNGGNALFNVTLSTGSGAPVPTAGITCTGATTCGQKTLSTGSGTVTVVSGCKALCTDTTANASVQCSVSSTTLTITGTGSDVINYFCF